MLVIFFSLSLKSNRKIDIHSYMFWIIMIVLMLICVNISSYSYTSINICIWVVCLPFFQNRFVLNVRFKVLWQLYNSIMAVRLYFILLLFLLPQTVSLMSSIFTIPYIVVLITKGLLLKN